MDTEFIWWQDWTGSSGIDACVAKVDGIFPTPDWEPPEKKDQSVSESRGIFKMPVNCQNITGSGNLL